MILTEVTPATYSYEVGLEDGVKWRERGTEGKEGGEKNEQTWTGANKEEECIPREGPFL